MGFCLIQARLHKATNTVCELKQSGATLTLLCNPSYQMGHLEYKPQVASL